MMNYVSDEQWRQLRVMLRVDGEAEAQARRAVNHVIFEFESGRGQSDGTTFEEAAQHGEAFLAGLQFAHHWAAVYKGRFPMLDSSPDPTLSEVTVATIQAAIDKLREAQALVDELTEHGKIMPPSPARNDRPWLREAVRRLFELWRRHRGEFRHGDQRRFFEFAVEALNQPGFGVTANSVNDAFKNHIAPELKLKKGL